MLNKGYNLYILNKNILFILGIVVKTLINNKKEDYA